GPLVHWVRWRAEGGYSQMKYNAALRAFCGEGGFRCEHTKITNLGGGVQIGGVGKGPAVPFLVFTVGAYRLNPDTTLPGFTSGDSETMVGLAVGGGLNYRIGQRWGVGADLRFHRFYRKDDSKLIAVNNDNSWFVAPTGQVFFRF